jgi:hypothetical protein
MPQHHARHGAFGASPHKPATDAWETLSLLVVLVSDKGAGLRDAIVFATAFDVAILPVRLIEAETTTEETNTAAFDLKRSANRTIVGMDNPATIVDLTATVVAVTSKDVDETSMHVVIGRRRKSLILKMENQVIHARGCDDRVHGRDKRDHL